MATNQPDAPGGGSSPMFGGQLLLVGLLAVAIVLLYRTFFAGGGGFGSLFSKPKEVSLTYVPSDFKPNIDEQAALQILAQPEAYPKEFSDLVYNFNLSLLYHVANRMNLPDSTKRKLEPEYRKHHDYLRNLYYNDFVALKDTTAGMYETWYHDNANQAVDLFNEVAGKYTCFFITQIMATVIKTNGGRILGRGANADNPCGIALNEGLKPLVERMKRQAAILDFSQSRGFLKERVRRGVAELATYELRSRMGLDKTLQYKFLGFAVSSTDIRVEAISVIKAGFKLDRYFDVTFSPKKGIIYVTLPPPEIVSHEVYPRIDKLDVGFLAGIDEAEMNRNFNDLRREFRRDAIENEHVLDHAKARADSVMQLMMGPMVKAMGRNYKLQVRFQEGQAGAPVTTDEARRRGEETETPRIQSPPKIKSPQTRPFTPQ
jgi:hypothetical protein